MAFLLISICLAAMAVQNLYAVNLAWNISAETKPNKGISKKILSYATGKATEGKLHAILGPSGSGKTTLLNILSSTVPYGSLNIYGDIDRTSSKFASWNDVSTTSVFVQQEDLLFAQLTVRETLDTSARLKASHETPSNMLNGLSNSFIQRLGLKKASDTVVGDAKTRGISGGEKKRLSIGNELINLQNGGDGAANNVVIFADEPTTGLDSYQAQKAVEILKELAAVEGYTVIASIHQPRSTIFELFDEITLMSEGRVIYSGEAKTMLEYFKGLGYTCPQYSNPPEYYLDLLSVDYSSPETEQESKARIYSLADAFARTGLGKTSTTTKINKLSTETKPLIVGKGGLRKKISTFFNHFGILFQRAFRQVVRDKPLNIARLMSGLFSALLFGSIYYKLGLGAATVADRLGLLQVAAVNTAMTSLIKATTSFVTEKLIVQRERRGKWYGIEPYFISKLIAETPLSAIFPCISGAIIYKLCGLNPLPGRLWKFLGILVVESMAATALGMSVGSFAPSVESAIAIAPAVMVVFIVFGGLYVVNTPPYLKWVPQMSLIRWAYEALCVNEFSNLKLIPSAPMGPLSVSDGNQVLESMGYAKSTIKGAIVAQLGIVVANYLFTYLSIKLQKPKFEPVKPYPLTEGAPSLSVIVADGRVDEAARDASPTVQSSSVDVSQMTVVRGNVRV